jgi:hypothetical protein
MRHWQLILAACWATIAVIIVFRRDLGLDIPGFGDSRWWLALALSCLLTIWNLVRWNASRPGPPLVEPLQPKSEQPPKYEYNPELDFQKMERDENS